MDEILARAGIFQGVEPSAVAALIKQLRPVDFPRGHTERVAAGRSAGRPVVINGRGREAPTAKEPTAAVSDITTIISIRVQQQRTGWPREPAHHHGAAGHVRGAVGF